MTKDKSFRLTPPSPPENCRTCPLFEHHYVGKEVPTELRGKPGNIKVMFIAEAPGDSEDRIGRPVIGKTGLILRRLVKQITGSEKNVAYGNIVRHRPSQYDSESKRLVDRPPSKIEVDHCKRNILADIDRLQPKYIVLLGASAAKNLARDPDTGSLIDPASRVNKIRGKEFLIKTPGGSYPALATYHFAAVARNPLLGGIFREDILKAFLRADGVDYSARGKPCVLIDTIPKLKKLLGKMSKGLTKDHVVMLDYETGNTSRVEPEILTVGFSWNGDRGYVIPYRHPESPFTGAEFRQVKGLLTKFFRLKNPSFGSLAAHNLKFEASVTMLEFGVRWDFPVECTQMRAHALNENRLNVGKRGAFALKSLSVDWLNFRGYLDEDIAKTVELVKSGRAREVPLKDLAEYNAMDCYVQNRLYEFQDHYARTENYEEGLRTIGRVLHGPISGFASWMESNGFLADKEMLRYFRGPKSPILTRQAEIEKELKKLPAVQKANALLSNQSRRTKGLRTLFKDKTPWLFSISKKSAKKALFFDVLELEWDQVTEKTGEPKINKEFYKEWEGVQEVDLIAEWAELDKLRSTYIEGVYKLLSHHADMRDGRVRGKLHLTLTVSSRSSYSDPNMQNIPSRGKFAKTIKNLYKVADGNVLVCADYSQAEVRWLAEISGDEKLLKAYKNAAVACARYVQDPSKENKNLFVIEGDFHRQTASQIFDKKPEEVTDQERGYSKCVHPETVVWTSPLPQKMKDLGFYGDKEGLVSPHQDIAVSTGRNGSTNVKVLYNGGNRELVHVIHLRGVLTCTKEHRFLLEDGSLKRAGDLVKGDVLCQAAVPEIGEGEYRPLPVTLGDDGVPTLWFTPDSDTAYFAGLFTGDGCRSGHGVFLAHGLINKADKMGVPYQEWQETLMEAARKVGISKVKRQDKTIRLGERRVMRFLSALGLVEPNDGPRTLTIPTWVLQAGRTAILHFLGGLFDTDGTVNKFSQLSMTTKSPFLVGQVLSVLRGLGLTPGMELSWNKTYERYYYRVRVSSREGGIFKPFMKHPGKLKRLRDFSGPARVFKPDQVLEVLPAGIGPCVDLEVEAEDHLYLTNGAVTHNTIVFGLVYGMSEFGLARRLKISANKAKEYRNAFLDQFPQAREWLGRIEEEGFQKGYVSSPIGRRRHVISGLLMDSPQGARGNLRSHKSYEDRACRNSPIQSVASDMNLLACAKIHRYVDQNDKNWKIVNVVHDSIMAEIPFDEVEDYVTVAEGIMTDPEIFSDFGVSVNVPLVADFTVGLRWGDQLEVSLLEKWQLSCNSCGEKRTADEIPANKRCEECGSKDVEIQLISGKLQDLLKVLQKQ